MSQQTNQVHRTLLAGMGGQGVLLSGLVLAQEAMSTYENVIWLPQYEGPMRGGECCCFVVLSSEKVASPWRFVWDGAILMNEHAASVYKDAVREGGTLIYDSSMITTNMTRFDLKIKGVPALKLAMEIGSRQCTNFVLLGAYLGLSQIVPRQEVERILEQQMQDATREQYRDVNMRALVKGYEAVA